LFIDELFVFIDTFFVFDVIGLLLKVSIYCLY